MCVIYPRHWNKIGTKNKCDKNHLSLIRELEIYWSHKIRLSQFDRKIYKETGHTKQIMSLDLCRFNGFPVIDNHCKKPKSHTTILMSSSSHTRSTYFFFLNTYFTAHIVITARDSTVLHENLKKFVKMTFEFHERKMWCDYSKRLLAVPNMKLSRFFFSYLNWI